MTVRIGFPQTGYQTLDYQYITLVPPESTISALTSIPQLWTLYSKLKIDQHGELS